MLRPSFFPASLLPPTVTFSPRVAQSGQNMRGNTRFPLLEGVKPLFQKQILTKTGLRNRRLKWSRKFADRVFAHRSALNRNIRF